MRLIKYTAKNIIKLILCFLLSCVISVFIDGTLFIFDSQNIVTYIGSLMGFSITIYTFGIGLLTQIKDLIYKHPKIEESKKEERFNLLIKSFDELKEDVSVIVAAFILLSLALVIESIPSFNTWINGVLSSLKRVGNYNTYTTIKIFAFGVSTWMFIDLIKTMLTVSEILLTLTRSNQDKK